MVKYKNSKGMHVFDYIAIVLLIIGGIAWGLFGLFSFNLIYTIFGSGLFSNIIFSLVGISAVYSIWSLVKLHK